MRTHPPSPPDYLMIANLLRFKRNPLQFLEMCARQYGDVVRTRFGPHDVYLMNHPDYIDRVLNDSTTFIKSSSARDVGGIFGEGLFTSKGEQWLSQRRMIQPALRRVRLDQYAVAMVECADRLVGEWHDHEVRDLHHEMSLLALGR